MKTRLTFLIVLLFLVHVCDAQKEQVKDEVFQRPPSKFTFELLFLFDNNLNKRIVSSNGFSSRAGLFLPSKSKFTFGPFVEWRIIPGLIEKPYYSDLSNPIYDSLLIYSGPDTLAINQLKKVLSPNSQEKFNGYIKTGIGLAFKFKMTRLSVLRANVGIIKKHFRTEGNDGNSNPYGDPGHYWLSTGIGYSSRIEYQLAHDLRKSENELNRVNFIAGLGREQYTFNKISYKDVNLAKALHLNISKNQNEIILYNLYFGVVLEFK